MQLQDPEANHLLLLTSFSTPRLVTVKHPDYSLPQLSQSLHIMGSIPNGTYVRLVDALSTTKLNGTHIQKADRAILDAPTNAKHDEFIATSKAQWIDQRLLDRFTQLTGRKPHRYLRRGIVFSHRDLDVILNRYENGQPIYLFTGRGPSSDSLHLGHSIPFEFTQYVF